MLLAFMLHFSGGQKPAMPNIGYLYSGYDIYKGNPLADRADPGFRNLIFKTSYSKKKTTSDLRFQLPDHVQARRTISCNGKFSSESIFTQTEYLRNLRVYVGISVQASFKKFAGSFSASTDYHKMEKTITSKNRAVVKSTATCNVYRAFINSFSKPKFTPNFINGLRKLSDGKKHSKYKFFKEFGTHYLREASMGSRYTMSFEISKDSYEKMKEKGVKVDVAASFAVGDAFKMSAESSTEEKKSWKNTFQKSVEKRSFLFRICSPKRRYVIMWMKFSDKLNVFNQCFEERVCLATRI